MLGNILEEEQQQQQQQQQFHHQQQELVGGLVEGAFGTVLEQELGLECDTLPPGKKAYGSGTPYRLSRSSSSAVMESGMSSVKRRGRPRGWTDARIQSMLTYLERNMTAWRSGQLAEFYACLAEHLGLDMGEAGEIQEKCEKMIKKYDSDRRRGDVSWKWYPRLNQVFDGPAIPAYGSIRLADDDAASSSLESCDEDPSDNTGEDLQLVKKARGEDPFQDRLEHEKLLLKLKRLKSKTEMRAREWEAVSARQAQAFEELKVKTGMAIGRLEKAIVSAGYLLDQAEMMAVAEEPVHHHHQEQEDQQLNQE